jgi:hypothetical protein
MEKIENCQNEADRSGVCCWYITAYDKNMEGQRGH